jgi:hypothetical protein
MMWLKLRERRGSIHNRAPLLKSSASRRKTFAAAMQQFEEQMTAAKIVTPATRPLNIYYGMAQAGMAIAAARTPDPWSFSSHGLGLSDMSPGLTEICVQPNGKGAFQVVASATGSQDISGPVSIGQLWNSLPDLIEETSLPGNLGPLALRIYPSSSSVFYTTTGRKTFPSNMSYSGPLRATALLRLDTLDPNASTPLRDRFVAYYPTVRDWAFQATWMNSEDRESGNVSVSLECPDSSSKAFSGEELDKAFDEIAPEYRYYSARYLRPSLDGDGKHPPSPLMTWWLLMYAFSRLARYQPRKWTDLLDLDKPGCATSVQYALEIAISVVPHLVLDALDGQPSLLSRPVLAT